MAQVKARRNNGGQQGSAGWTVEVQSAIESKMRVDVADDGGFGSGSDKSAVA
jgi:hypothetical protein